MMGYGQEPYEDELDRMRARRQRKKQQESAPASRASAQGWDDTIIYRKPGDPSYDADPAGFQDFDLDEDWDQDTDLNFETLDLEDDTWESPAAPSRIRSGKRPSGHTSSDGSHPNRNRPAGSGRAGDRGSASEASSFQSGGRKARTRQPDPSRAGAAASRPEQNYGGKKKKKGHAVSLFLLLAVLIGAGTFYSAGCGRTASGPWPSLA